jgi:glucokinase-like ROK family protein
LLCNCYKVEGGSKRSFERLAGRFGTRRGEGSELATESAGKRKKGQILVDDPHSLSKVLTSLQRSERTTRPELARVTGLGRTLIAKHVDIALKLNLINEGNFGSSTGGRVPRLLEFNKDAGYLLVAALGATGMTIARSDLLGSASELLLVPIDISVGPEKVLTEVEKIFDKIALKEKVPLFGIGMGLPGPVEFATGVPMSPPIMPGWDKYAVRDRFAYKYQSPVWIDNDVNLMALGEASLNVDEKHQELIYIKIGTGIGAGIISNNALHRGAQGSAGDIGHIAISEPTQIVCRCGNIGCLEAVAGGAALARDAQKAVELGKSTFLAERLKKNRILTSQDVTDGAQNGDAWSVEAITHAGRQVGQVLATIINFFNPALVVIGGGVSSAGNLLLASVRETVYRRSLPLATRDLEIRLGEVKDEVGLRGAAEMVLAELFSPHVLEQWAGMGRPQLPIVY